MIKSLQECFDALGVTQNASEQEIKRAYRKLAMKYHPDKNKGNKEAEKKFIEISDAYAILTDPDKRNKFSQDASSVDEQRPQESSAFAKAYKNSVNNHKKQKKPRVSVVISLEEALRGCTKSINVPIKTQCPKCSHKKQTCSKCGGTGVIQGSHKTPFGVFTKTMDCDACRGTGIVTDLNCPDCHGTGTLKDTKKVDVTLPANSTDDYTIERSDIFLDVTIDKSNQPIKLIRGNIIVPYEIPLLDALLGTTKTDTFLGESLTFIIPEGTQPNDKVYIRSKGYIDPSKGKGDLILLINIRIPRGLSDMDKLALSKILS